MMTCAKFSKPADVRLSPGCVSPGRTAYPTLFSDLASGRRASSLSGLSLAFGLLCLAPGPSWAHAHLLKATPAQGSTVHGNPVEVTLQFTQDLEPALTRASVLGERGDQIESGATTVDQNERRTLHVPLKTGLSGTYHVNWHAVSTDSRETEGQYTFTVAP
jgi:methionine-rich copper-binding protein CopC